MDKPFSARRSRKRLDQVPDPAVMARRTPAVPNSRAGQAERR
jgi:hypothetical protein